MNGAPVVVDLLSKGGTRVDGSDLVERRTLGARGSFDMGGVVVEYSIEHGSQEHGALVLWPTLQPATRTVAPIVPPHAEGAADVDVDVPSPTGSATLRVRLDAAGRALVLDAEPVRLNGEKLQRPTLLLEGDRIEAPGFVCTIARS